jgi:ribose transport system substrate-binding protein
MKKILCIVIGLMLVLGLALVGCTPEAAQESSEPVAEKQTTQKTEETTEATEITSDFTGNEEQEYYMVTFYSGYPFWVDCYNGFEAAAELYGVKTVYGGTTEYDVNAAITALDQIIAKKPSGIALTCMDAEAYIPYINKAIEMGIPVVTFDSDSPSSERIAFIGTMNYEAGATAARYIGGKLGGTGKVAAVTSLGQTNIKERTQGFEETMAAEYPDVEVVQIVDGGTDQIQSATAVANMLKVNTDVDYMFCALVTASIGAQQAIEEAGMTGEIKIVAFDTDTVTLDSIKSGEVEASISQAPWCMGYWTMNYLYFLKNGLINPVDDWQAKGYPAIPATADSGSTVVTVENADNFYTPEE